MPKQSRKNKRGGNVNLSEVNESMENNTSNELQNKNNVVDQMNVVDTKNLDGGKYDNQLQNDNSIQMNVQELNNNNNHENDNANNSSNLLGSVGNMFQNAVKGLTGGNKRKVGGSTPLQTQLFTSLRNRSEKLSENMNELDNMQTNLKHKTDSVKIEVEGLQQQFKTYNKMNGGRKSRHSRKHRKSKRKHRKSKRKHRKSKRRH